MNRTNIITNLTVRNLSSRYLINNILLGINGALEIEEIKADIEVFKKLESLKDDLLSIECPINSEPKTVKPEDQQKASSIGSRAYILIANYLEEKLN